MNNHIDALSVVLEPYGYVKIDIAGGDDFDTKERIFPYTEVIELILKASRILGYSADYDSIYYIVLMKNKMLSISEMLEILDIIKSEEDDFADHLTDAVYPE